MSNHLDCEALPSSVRSARLFVVDKLQEWRCDDLVDRAALLTSELATNAVVHTRLPYSVSVERTGSTVRVEVTDRVEALPTRPHRPDPGDASAGSRDIYDTASDTTAQLFSGLGIVDLTATAWGSEPIPGEGKIVWFELLGGLHDAESQVRSAQLRDMREPTPSSLASDLDRPLDAWVIALGGPRLSRALRVALGMLLVVLAVVLFTLVGRG